MITPCTPLNALNSLIALAKLVACSNGRKLPPWIYSQYSARTVAAIIMGLLSELVLVRQY